MTLSIIAFEPSLFSLYVRPSSVPGRMLPSGPADVVAALGGSLQAALDGPMFDRCDSGLIGTDAERYAASQCARILYAHFDRESGLNIPSTEPGSGITIGVRENGEAFSVSGGVVPADARTAVQLFPTLVRDGQVIVSNDGNNAERNWRAGMGVLRDGRLAFAVMNGASMPVFAQALIDAGFVSAGYSDGGGSTSLITPGARVGSSEGRRVASFLVARAPGGFGGLSRIEPGTIAIVAGSVAGGLVLLTGAALAVRWYRTHRSRL